MRYDTICKKNNRNLLHIWPIKQKTGLIGWLIQNRIMFHVLFLFREFEWISMVSWQHNTCLNNIPDVSGTCQFLVAKGWNVDVVQPQKFSCHLTWRSAFMGELMRVSCWSLLYYDDHGWPWNNIFELCTLFENYNRVILCKFSNTSCVCLKTPNVKDAKPPKGTGAIHTRIRRRSFPVSKGWSSKPGPVETLWKSYERNHRKVSKKHYK